MTKVEDVETVQQESKEINEELKVAKVEKLKDDQQRVEGNLKSEKIGN